MADGVLSLRLIVGISLELGFAGNVEKGPSVTERLLGGLPLSFPADVLPLLGHAEETAGPWRRRARLFGVMAERGSFASFHKCPLGVIADCGYADNGV